MFNTDNLAVPIPMVEPIEMLGTFDTNISVTIPAAVIAGVSAIKFAVAEDIATTCSPFKPAINVDIPDITTVSKLNSV